MAQPNTVKDLGLIHFRGWGDSNVKLCEGLKDADYLSQQESLLSHIYPEAYRAYFYQYFVIEYDHTFSQ